MSKSIFILGRQPALGLAELESLFGAAALRPVRSAADSAAAVVDADPASVDFRRLGGSIKFGRVLTELDTTNWAEIEKHPMRAAPEHAQHLPEGKLSLGISAYGFGRPSRSVPAGRQPITVRSTQAIPGAVTPDRLLATGLTLKKAIRKTGRPVRLIPNKELELNSASVLHNNLTGSNGWELLLVRDGSRTILAQTMDVQDIDSYTLRDRGRPKRDARVGMLPPKLAQIIINLARPTTGGTVLDPFCGTGVVLQEAILMGFSAYGTDLEPRMIEYSQANLDWLLDNNTWLAKNVREHKSRHFTLEVQDATSFLANRTEHDIEAVACETYLGRPFTSPPSPEVLNQTVSECNLIIKKFIGALSTQIPQDTRLCLAVPAWRIRPGQFKHLPLLGNSGSIDSLAELGYNRISFEHVRSEDLIYFREDQIVARELLVLQKS